jgi:hypothetical protein
MGPRGPCGPVGVLKKSALLSSQALARAGCDVGLKNRLGSTGWQIAERCVPRIFIDILHLSLTSLECRASGLANSDARPRATTGVVTQRCWTGSADRGGGGSRGFLTPLSILVPPSIWF